MYTGDTKTIVRAGVSIKKLMKEIKDVEVQNQLEQTLKTFRSSLRKIQRNPMNNVARSEALYDAERYFSLVDSEDLLNEIVIISSVNIIPTKTAQISVDLGYLLQKIMLQEESTIFLETRAKLEHFQHEFKAKPTNGDLTAKMQQAIHFLFYEKKSKIGETGSNH